MPQRFFLEDGAVTGGGVVIDGRLAHHIARSLRMRAGESIVVVDREGREHGVLLRHVTDEQVGGDITWSREVTGEPRLRITVLQALPRDRMEDCVDLLVEAGAAELWPVITERVVNRPPDDRVAQRVRRWQAIATEAAQLAGRGTIPRVRAPVALADALADARGHMRVVACAFEGERPVAALDVSAGGPLALCIGPEGGFGELDLEALRGADAELAHLGARVLRTRFAGAIACALLLGRSGDLDAPVAIAPS